MMANRTGRRKMVLSGPGFWAVVALAAALIPGACAPVRPWEKGDLARPSMALDPDPQASALRQHVYRSREAASGGYGVGGGGCGCN